MKIYGIRHHGPGCARSLRAALAEQQPDLVLLEAPAEAEALVPDAAAEGMAPPVAALLYQTDQPQNAAFYPFASFSPEWQAMQWALEHGVPVRCFDLPASTSFALQAEESDEEETVAIEPIGDPFHYFAVADGYSDGERWWNDKVEERQDSATFFVAILEAVTELRRELGIVESRRTLLREAWMRKCMRQASKDGFENVAVVCGAWHAPALIDQPKVSEDNALLKGLPKVKVSATWAPWTYSRLTARSGYGAGVRSPGWYDHLWSRARHPYTTWMTKAARVLRKQDYEGSSASIIEATRLAESLAALRGRPQPGLAESLESMQAVYCVGDAMPLSLLNEPLLIGKKLGTLPDGISTLPLQKDIEAQQNRLRLKPTAEIKVVTLDLREESGRSRSALLHRLLAVAIEWGTRQEARTKGTFKETWRLHWKPEFTLEIIDASRYGNTLETAATSKLLEWIPDTTIADITERLDLALLADLSTAATGLAHRLDDSAATSNDAVELIRAVPALVRIVRYGDVRKTDASSLERILGQFTARVHIALPGATLNLAEAAAREMAALLRGYTEALNTLQDEATSSEYRAALGKLARRQESAPEPAGYATRVLRDAGGLETDEIARLFALALSPGGDPGRAAAWLEGFLSGSGAVIVHDPALLGLVDQWIASLSDETFQNVLPLVRRTFGSFTSPERSRIGEIVRKGAFESTTASAVDNVDLDWERALPALTTVTRLLELPLPELP
ncbi:MAG: DUF5682 family protein [Verrucomicrobiales bacterium]